MAIKRLNTNAFEENAVTSNNILDGSVIFDDLSTSANLLPVVNRIVYTDSNFNDTDDTAADNIDAGYIKIIGSGFTPTTQIYVSGIVVPSERVVYVSSTELRVTLIGLATGVSNLYTVNSDGTVAIKVNGLRVNPKPVFTTTEQNLGYVFSDNFTSLQISATGNPAYTLYNGSIPQELTLSTDIGTGNGVIQGTVTTINAVTDFNFGINATNQYRQNTINQFRFTVLPNDGNYKDTILHLSGDSGLLNANNTNTVNFSDVSYTFNNTGNLFLGSLSPYTQGGYSANFNGSSDLVYVQNNEAFRLGGADFTIEFYMRANSIIGNVSIFSIATETGSGEYGIRFDQNAGNTTLKGGHFDGHTISMTGNLLNMSNIFTNTWKHLALERYNGNLSLYLDGVKIIDPFFGSSVNATGVEFSTIGNSYIGASARALTGIPQNYYHGLLSNFRVQKSEAVYTREFNTPRFLLQPNTNTSLLLFSNPSFSADYSPLRSNVRYSGGYITMLPEGPLTNRKAYDGEYGGSVFFDQSNYLQGATSSENPIGILGANVFTLEGWVYPFPYNGEGTIVSYGFSEAGIQANIFASPSNTYLYFNRSVLTAGGTGGETLDYLVVGGGGGGGKDIGGGGGAGGYRTGTYTVSSNTSITVSIGPGAAGSTSSSSKGGTGTPSSISAPGLSITAAGGGGGTSRNAGSGGNPGGSGGGGATVQTAGGTGNSPAVTPSQGNPGGTGGGSGSPGSFAGGGGGAGAAGSGTSGGNGLQWFNGSYYAGGGGGGGFTNTGVPGGTGGLGGGATAASDGQNGPDGTPNTGGGGAGQSSSGPGQGGAGGSGVVIFRYPGTSVRATGGSSIASLGAYTYHQFNSPGTLFFDTTTTKSTLLTERIGVANTTNSTWNHFALVKDYDANIKIYLNGILNKIIPNGANVFLGTRAILGSNNNFRGFTSDIRLTREVVYTGNFIPPIKGLGKEGNSSVYVNTTNVNTSFSSANTLIYLPFSNAGILDDTAKNTLVPVGNVFIDNNGIFGRAVNFGGGFLYVAPPDLSTFRFDIHDFTVESWIYTNTQYAGTSGFIIDFRTSTTTNAPALYMASGTVRWYNGTVDFLTTPTLSAGFWYHIAVSRSRGRTRLYLNGDLLNTGGTIDNYMYQSAQPITNRPVIGVNGTVLNNNFWSGRIDDLRVTKFARYTTNRFELPTRAFRKL